MRKKNSSKFSKKMKLIHQNNPQKCPYYDNKKESHTYEYNLTCKESKDCTFVTFQRDLLTQHVAENHPPKDRPKTKCPDCDAKIENLRRRGSDITTCIEKAVNNSLQIRLKKITLP